MDSLRSPGRIRPGGGFLAASDIPDFVGAWTHPLEAQEESFEMTIAVTEGESGRAAARISGPDEGNTEVETVSLDGETLELAYETTAQGTTFPVLIRMTPVGDGTLCVELDFADGQFPGHSSQPRSSTGTKSRSLCPV